MTNKPADDADTEWVTGNIRISIDGQPLELQMTVPANPVKLQRMLPIISQLSDSFAQTGINSAAGEGKTVSCAKGCNHCCHQLIPVAEAEAFMLADLVNGLPEPRRSEIKSRFDAACRHFIEIGWLTRLDECINLSESAREAVSIEYFREKVPCPFLEDGLCSIYEHRPTVCREYLATSPAENCASPTRETIRLVKLPLTPSRALRKVGTSGRLNRIVNFLPLILAMKWAESNPDDLVEKTGERWMAELFQKMMNTDEAIPESGI